MTKFLQPALILALIVGSFVIVGCGSKEDPNYSTEIKKTEEDKAREAANMANQKATEPGAMKMPPGKGGH